MSLQSYTVNPEETEDAAEDATAPAVETTEETPAVPAEIPETPADEEPAPEQPKTPVAIPQITSPEDTAKAAQDAGVDLNALSQEFMAKGVLSEETYRGLAEKGFTRQVVDTYIDGQQAIAREYVNGLAAHAGGEQALDAMMRWAGTGLTASERTAYNKALASSDLDTAKLALDGLKAKYTAANGSPGKRVNGAAAAVARGPQPFEHADELTNAMRDRRYKTDAKYRKSVDARAEVSDLFAISY